MKISKDSLIVAAVTAFTFFSPFFIKPGNVTWARRFLVNGFSFTNLIKKAFPNNQILLSIPAIIAISLSSGVNIITCSALYLISSYVSQNFPDIMRVALAKLPDRFLSLLSVNQMLIDNNFKINIFGLEVDSYNLLMPLYVATAATTYLIEQGSFNRISKLQTQKDNNPVATRDNATILQRFAETAKYFSEFLLICAFQFTKKAGPLSDPFLYVTVGAAWTNFANYANPEARIREMKLDDRAIEQTPRLTPPPQKEEVRHRRTEPKTNVNALKATVAAVPAPASPTWAEQITEKWVRDCGLFPK